jgi:cell division protein FtsI (penicillin-binding protein 3)
VVSGTSIGSIPIGQGIAVTAAADARSAYNVLANDGLYVPPKLVLETVDASRRPATRGAAEPRRVVSEQTAAPDARDAGERGQRGNRHPGRHQGYQVAGKTGTARKPQPGGGYHDEDGNYRYVATFTGFVPAERPELSIIVVIDEPSGDIFGGTVAAPVFADLAQYGLRLLRRSRRAVEPPAGARQRGGPRRQEEAVVPTTASERRRPARARCATTSTTLGEGPDTDVGGG